MMEVSGRTHMVKNDNQQHLLDSVKFHGKEIDNLEKKVVDEVRNRATSKWGLKIQELTITENVPHNVQRLFHEGGVYVPTEEFDLLEDGKPDHKVGLRQALESLEAKIHSVPVES